MCACYVETRESVFMWRDVCACVCVETGVWKETDGGHRETQKNMCVFLCGRRNGCVYMCRDGCNE